MSKANIPTILSAAASLAVIAGFVLARKREPMRLAPGVEYEAVITVSPPVPASTATRMVASVLGEVVNIQERRNDTLIKYRFKAIAPREVKPGETLFQLEGRKAVLKSIREAR